mmetsp:Transcript_25086/g.52804  ORF Transcript_25086/g.52804 Transcript_25086/m.52804 type:complete len:389 (-) Transcript_25086:188-1354(-)
MFRPDSSQPLSLPENLNAASTQNNFARAVNEDNTGNGGKKYSNKNNNVTAQEQNGPEGDKVDFPGFLHRIVSDPETDHCIHWLYGGTHFFISDKKKFAKEILPVHYNHTKFPSFIRRLKRWGFIRVPSGPLMGAYYNPNFKKGEANRASLVKYNPQVMLAHEAIRINNSRAFSAFAGSGCLMHFAALGHGLGPSIMPETDSYLNNHGMNSFMVGRGLPKNVASSNAANALLQNSLARRMQPQGNTRFLSQSSNPNFFPRNGMGNGVNDAASVHSLKQRLIQMGANGLNTSSVTDAFSASNQNNTVLDQMSRSNNMTTSTISNNTQQEHFFSMLVAKRSVEQGQVRRQRNDNIVSLVQGEERTHNAPSSNFSQNGSDFDISKSTFPRGK